MPVVDGVKYPATYQGFKDAKAALKKPSPKPVKKPTKEKADA